MTPTIRTFFWCSHAADSVTRPRSQLIGALIALNVAANLVRHYGLASCLLTSVGIIVDLHFIGLWLATRMPRFLWIAGAMCAVSTLAAFLPAASADFNPRNAATGFANALVLWIGASY